MSLSQIVILSAILFLVLTNDTVKIFLLSMFEKVKLAISNAQKAKVEAVKVDSPVEIHSTAINKVAEVESPSLARIVSKWEELRNMCKDYNLTEAENKLEEVFPLLLKDEDKDIV